MTQVTLIYPYFNPSNDQSIFRFPPLGLGYIASYLQSNGTSVEIIDCTFSRENEIINRLKKINSPIVGIYSMYTMMNNSLRFARLLRSKCDLLVAGGPLPTACPELFLQDFDIVVRGEGEQTMLEIVKMLNRNGELDRIQGTVYKKSLNNTIDDLDPNNDIIINPQRELIPNLDSIPFPSRDLFDNEDYKHYYATRFGYTTTSIITSRGCPFNCDFCSKPIFGNIYRMRTAKNIVDEIEDVLSLGYDKIFFQDDCFTLDQQRVKGICDEIIRRKLKVTWECLSRVDSVDSTILSTMKEAGCIRVFFGIESGNNEILQNIMKKQFTAEQARKAVETTVSAGIKVGAFFILGYPGETNKTILETIHFATSLALDYISFTVPYPIPGTGLFERLKKNVKTVDPGDLHHRFIDHTMNYDAQFSEKKIKFAIAKAMAQFVAKKHLNSRTYRVLFRPIELLTDSIFRALK